MFSQQYLNVRQAIWMEFLSEFEFDIKRIKGKENKIADALSIHAYNIMEVAVSNSKTNFIEKIQNTIINDPKYLEIQHKLQQIHIPGYT